VRGLGLLGLNDSLLRSALLTRDELRLRVLLHPDRRMVATEAALWVSVFDAEGEGEGHSGAQYMLVPAPAGGVLYRGYRREFDALRVDAERVI